MKIKFIKDAYSASAGMVEDYPTATAKRLIAEGVAEKVMKAAPLPKPQAEKPKLKSKRKGA